jgi:hypothetical protein
MLLLSKLPTRLLWVAHLLVIFLLPAAYVFLVYQGEYVGVAMYIILAWEKLALLLPFGVAGLLVWRLWQRRWGQAAALALLLGVDVLVRYGYYLAFFVSSMTENPT